MENKLFKFAEDVSRKAYDFCKNLVKEQALKEKEAEKQRLATEKEAEELRQKIVLHEQEIKPLHDIFKKTILLDSNILMDEYYNHFFIILLELANRYDTTLLILPSQFDEMENLKNQKKKSYGARLAFRRIAKLQNCIRVIIPNLKHCADKNAYADKKFFSHFDVKENRSSSVLITNDCSLRVRLAAIYGDSSFLRSGDDILQLMYKYCFDHPVTAPRKFNACDGGGYLYRSGQKRTHYVDAHETPKTSVLSHMIDPDYYVYEYDIDNMDEHDDYDDLCPYCHGKGCFFN